MTGALLLRVAAAARVSVRRIWVSLSPLFPRQELFAHCPSRLREATPGKVVIQGPGLAGRRTAQPGAGVSAQRLLAGHTAQSVPEHVGMRGRGSCTRALLPGQDRIVWQVSSRRIILEVQDAKIQTSPSLETYPG